jgi:hypothetical protein
MSYYTGCQLKITLPPDRATDEETIRQGLIEKFPGIDIQFISSSGASRPTVAEAFVPKSYPMAGMGRQDSGNTEMKPVTGEVLLGIASEALNAICDW